MLSASDSVDGSASCGSMAYCLSNPMHSIGRSIKSPEFSCVHPCVQLFVSSLPSTFLFFSFFFPFPFSSPFPFSFPFSISFSFHFPFHFPFPFLSPSSSPFSSLFPSTFPSLYPLSLFFSPSSSLFPFLFLFPLFLPLPLSFFIFFSFPFFFLFPFSFFFPCQRLYIQHLRRHISITVPDRRMVTMEPTESRPPEVEWSRDRWRHVTPKGQTRDPIIFDAPYLYNSAR